MNISEMFKSFPGFQEVEKMATNFVERQRSIEARLSIAEEEITKLYLIVERIMEAIAHGGRNDN